MTMNDWNQLTTKHWLWLTVVINHSLWDQLDIVRQLDHLNTFEPFGELNLDKTDAIGLVSRDVSLEAMSSYEATKCVVVAAPMMAQQARSSLSTKKNSHATKFKFSC